MRYVKEEHIRDFQAWQGGKDTLDRIIELGKEDELESYFEELASTQDEPLTETEINDILWFETQQVYEAIGLNEDGEIPCNEEWELFTEVVEDEETQTAIIEVLKDFNHKWNEPLSEAKLRELITKHNLKEEVQDLNPTIGQTTNIDLIGTINNITFDFVLRNVPTEQGDNAWHCQNILTVQKDDELGNDCYIHDIIDEYEALNK